MANRPSTLEDQLRIAAKKAGIEYDDFRIRGGFNNDNGFSTEAPAERTPTKGWGKWTRRDFIENAMKAYKE